MSMNNKPIKIINNQHNDMLNVRWNPNNVCNFKCRYCFPESNTGTHRSPQDLQLVIDNFSYMLEQYKTIGKTRFHFMIAGGEPTLWKELGTFMREMKSRFDMYFTLISNGSRTLRWWEEHSSEIDDAHLTLHVAEGNVEHMLDVADILYEAGTKTTVKVLMDPEYWDTAVEWVEYMKKYSKHPWFIQVAEVIEQEQVYSKTNKKRYTEDQLKYIDKESKRWPGPLWFWRNRHLFKDHLKIYESKAVLENGKILKAKPGTYLNKDVNHFKGWECNIGLETVYIDWAGEIKGSCNAHVFNADPYYNILDKDFIEKFNLKNEPIICPYNDCYCLPETHVTKFKI
jgi:MoaA/NifB/PqqE/SkfB family radical SAM enzyme